MLSSCFWERQQVDCKTTISFRFWSNMWYRFGRLMQKQWVRFMTRFQRHLWCSLISIVVDSSSSNSPRLLRFPNVWPWFLRRLLVVWGAVACAVIGSVSENKVLSKFGLKWQKLKEAMHVSQFGASKSVQGSLMVVQDLNHFYGSSPIFMHRVRRLLV